MRKIFLIVGLFITLFASSQNQYIRGTNVFIQNAAGDTIRAKFEIGNKVYFPYSSDLYTHNELGFFSKGYVVTNLSGITVDSFLVSTISKNNSGNTQTLINQYPYQWFIGSYHSGLRNSLTVDSSTSYGFYYSGALGNYYFPRTQPTSGKVLGATDNSGTLGWIDGGSGGGAAISLPGFTSAVLMGGVIRPVRDTLTGQNTWEFINDADHTMVGFDSISVDDSKITVWYTDTFQKISSIVVTPDESMITENASSKAIGPFYNAGGYQAGSRVFLDHADIYVARPKGASVQITWNGSAWVVQDYLPEYWGNSASPAWTVSWSNGRLRIKDIPFLPRSFGVTMVSPNGAAQNMAFTPSVEGITSYWYDIYFYDVFSRIKFTDATPPTGFSIKIDLGTVQAKINPKTEDFGPSSNFWIMGLMKLQ